MFTLPFIPKISSYPTGVDILDVFDIALSCLFRFIQLFVQPRIGEKQGTGTRLHRQRPFLVYEEVPTQSDLD